MEKDVLTHEIVNKNEAVYLIIEDISSIVKTKKSVDVYLKGGEMFSIRLKNNTKRDYQYNTIKEKMDVVSRISIRKYITRSLNEQLRIE